MYSHEKFRRRLDELFADVERLAADPAGRTSAGRKALDEMRTRLAQLEAEFTEINKKSPAEPQVPPPAAAIVDPNPVVSQTGKSRHVTPLLYEKEQVGYAFAGLSLQPLQDTDSQVSGGTAAITAPLTVGGDVIGRMQIEPPVEKPLSAEEVSLLNAVAQQASVQIQNLRLLEATERARSEAEAATRRFIHESWDSYLDGIQHHERVGYV